MLLPHDARHNIWFARNYPFGFPCSFISFVSRSKRYCRYFQTTFPIVSLHLYNDIRLVTPTPPIGTVSAVTL